MTTFNLSKTEFQTQGLLEVVNNEWKVLSLENGRSVYTQLEYEVGRKSILKSGLILRMVILVMQELRDVLASCSLTKRLVHVTNQHHIKHLQKGLGSGLINL
jgi:hypothetical protein